MKLLHTADWHLGAGMSSARDRAAEARAARVRAAERVAELAREHEVELVLVAGDFFDNHDVDDGVVQRALEVLERMAPTPVLLIPGNHDMHAPGGVWERASWRPPEHVRLLLEREAVEVAGALVYPCPITQKRSRRDPTAWIPRRAAEEAEVVRIGLAHGGLEVGGWESNFPIAPDRAETAELDYLALGDWHGHRVDGPRTAYPGAVEPTKFGETEAGQVLLVEIEGAGAVPVLTPLPTGILTWRALDAEIRDETDVEALAARVAALGPAEELLLRLEARLAGAVEPGTASALAALLEELEGSCFLFEAEVDEAALLGGGAPDLPEGLLREADETLGGLLDGRIPESEMLRSLAALPPEVLAEARSLLHQVAKEAAS